MYTTDVKVYLKAGEQFLLSEGRYTILKAIAETGSLSRAAAKLGMSYRYLWGVVRKVEAACGEKVVERERGGKRGGAAWLTPVGRELLEVFERENTTIKNYARYKHLRKPLLTADGVLIKNGKILLVKRKNEPWKGMYALPGGFVEYGERVEDTVLREVHEETGLEAQILGIVGVYSSPDRDPRGHIITVAYLLDVPSLETARAGDDASDVKIFELSAIPQLASDHQKIVRDAVKILKKDVRSKILK
ncbi:MAG: NUDIX domain-containing protein [Thermoplasmata archaeon]|nr:NUDIX domain-containing protein [Thermoplasmata archaeon]